MNSKPPYHVPTMAEIARRKKNGFKVASLFSGCGGSSLGYKMAGYKVVAACEFVEAARECYAANFPGTPIYPGDVRALEPSELMRIAGVVEGELDVLDGSPPCASFSTTGKREKDWGQVKKYSDVAQRSDDLFFEYARLVRGVRPKVFVAENVAGLVIGTAKGYFKAILRELKSCGYRVEARVLDAQWLGVPQARRRVIFVGTREDLGVEPKHPSPFPYRYSMRDALPWIEKYVEDTRGQWSRGDLDTNRPMVTVTVQSSKHLKVSARLSVEQSEAYMTFTSGFNKGERFSIDDPAPTIMAGGIAGSSSQCRLVNAPISKNEKENLQVDGEYRKFTIAELRRLCAFPDDFELTGTYAQQWERLGRAVPPLMMRAVASTVEEILRCAE